VLPIARDARSRFLTLTGDVMAPRLIRRVRALSIDADGGAVGKGKFSTSDIPSDRIYHIQTSW
jgi:hypothetical protein